MTSQSATFDLPPVMKLEDCQLLHAFLQESQGSAVALNCNAVTRVTGMAAQMMHFASIIWAKEDIAFSLHDPSEDCIESLSTLGFAALLDDDGAVA